MGAKLAPSNALLALYGNPNLSSPGSSQGREPSQHTVGETSSTGDGKTWIQATYSRPWKVGLQVPQGVQMCPASDPKSMSMTVTSGHGPTWFQCQCCQQCQ